MLKHRCFLFLKRHLKKNNVTIVLNLHKQYERGGITLDKLFIELCNTYHHKILKYLYYAIGNEQDALDLTQEVFVIVYKKNK